MFRYLLPIIALVFLGACGDDGEDVATDASPTPSNAPGQRLQQYMQLGEARELLTSLGLEDTSLSADAYYECIQIGCPEEVADDDSWGCLTVLPTGDPANAESLYPDDPPGWYSVVWRGTFGETYGSAPERVVNEPTATLEPHDDAVCGNGAALKATAAEAVAFLAEVGMEGVWQNQAPPAPTCAPAATCPIPGIPADTPGCIGISVFDLPERFPGVDDPTTTVYINWSSDPDEENPEGLQRIYSALKPLSKVEAAVAAAGRDVCVESPIPASDPYDSVPYTDSIQPSYWRLGEAPAGNTLLLGIAAGGGCDEFERVDVEEAEGSVTIKAYIRHSNPGPNGACTDELNGVERTVELDAPLGDRELLGCAPEEIWYLDHDIDCAEPGHI